jgi:hypothetical protein
MRSGFLIGILAAGLSGPVLAQGQTPVPGTEALSPAELRELVEGVKETAKAARENTDYARVVPDILTQILIKLDKIENKLDKIENATKANAPRRSVR